MSEVGTPAKGKDAEPCVTVRCASKTGEFFPLKLKRTGTHLYRNVLNMVVAGLILPNSKALQACTNPKNGNRALDVGEKHLESG